MGECGRCHRIVQGKLHYIQGRDIYVCQDCADEAYCKCSLCGGYFVEGDVDYPEAGKTVCIWCANKHYIICSCCHEFLREDKAVKFHGQLMCRSCREEYFSRCDCCHQKFESDALFDATKKNGKSVEVCLSCLHENFRRCTLCKEWVSPAKSCILGGKVYCNDCAEYGRSLSGGTVDNRSDVASNGYGLLGICAARDFSQSQDTDSSDDDEAQNDEEAQYDDGYDDDYVGDGLDGTDDHVGDGLDGDDDDDAPGQ